MSGLSRAKKARVGVVAAAALAMTLSACGGGDSGSSEADSDTGSSESSSESSDSGAGESSDEKLVIGYGAAVTGELAPYDSPDGVQCRIEQINEAGGIDGRQVELVVRDTKSDAATAAAVAQELIDLGANVMLGPPTDDGLIPMAGLAQAEGIPLLSVGSTQAQYPLAAPDNGFLVPYADNAAAAAAAEYALSQGAETAYLLFSPDIGSYSQETPRYFGEVFTQGGGTIIGEDNYSAGLSDYSTQITKIQNLDEKPDVIFIAMLVPDIGVFVRQLKAAGLEIPVYGTDGFDDPTLIEVGEDGADLAVFATHGFPEEGNALAEFYADCEERGYTVQNIFFGLGGESVDIIKAAVESAGSTNPADINAAIKEIENLPGITTSSITYKDRGGIPLKEMAIVSVQDGEFVAIGRVLPEFVPEP